MERDHLFNAKNEALEMVEKLEKKKDLILRENEKLKLGMNRGRLINPKKTEHHKTLSNHLPTSPSKSGEYSSQRYPEFNSVRNEYSPIGEYKRSYPN